MEPTRETILADVRRGIEQGLLNADEVRAALASAGAQPGSTIARKTAVAIGTVLSVTGFAVLTALHWGEFSSGVRMLLTLGAGLVALAVAIVMHMEREARQFAAAFYLIGFLLIPSGVVVSTYELGYSLTLESTHIFMALATMLIFAVPVFLCGSNIMLLAACGAFGWLFFSVTQALAPESYYFARGAYFRWQNIILGLSYVGAAIALRRSVFQRICGPLYFFGSAAALTAAYYSMGWGADMSRMWEIVYPAFCIASIYAGVELHSRSLLINGALAMNAYIARISYEHFAASFGWPVTMIIAGLGIIAMATYSLDLYREQSNKD